jgi:hypothetical protein
VEDSYASVPTIPMVIATEEKAARKSIDSINRSLQY